MEKKLLAQGNIRKMQTRLEPKVAYQLPIGDAVLDMNALLDQQIEIHFEGQINCVHCDRLTKKSFNQGYCYPCFRKLAECDSCIMSPEKCHFHLGTCRDEEWAQTHCMVDHIVYLANSSGLKVGITRATQVPTRWMDQGAVQAIPLLKTKTRYLSGLVEVALKQYVSDRTQWQRMLKNDVDVLDLQEEKEKLLAIARDDIIILQAEHGEDAIQVLATDNSDETQIDYPVLQHPVKIKSFNLDKEPTIRGKLLGIKGQYLILDTGVINLRKYTAYLLSIYQLS